MGYISRFLVFIQHTLPVWIHKAGTVHPHIAPASGRAPITVYKNRSLICLNNMVTIEEILKIIMENSQILFTKAYHPVCHGLTGNGQDHTARILFSDDRAELHSHIYCSRPQLPVTQKQDFHDAMRLDEPLFSYDHPFCWYTH